MVNTRSKCSLKIWVKKLSLFWRNQTFWVVRGQKILFLSFGKIFPGKNFEDLNWTVKGWNNKRNLNNSNQWKKRKRKILQASSYGGSQCFMFFFGFLQLNTTETMKKKVLEERSETILLIDGTPLNWPTCSEFLYQNFFSVSSRQNKSWIFGKFFEQNRHSPLPTAFLNFDAHFLQTHSLDQLLIP